MIYDYPNNKVDSSSIVSPSAIIGKGNYIGPNCYIGPNVIIGDNNRIEGFASIGTPAEHRDYFRSTSGKVSIGNNNVIREFTTIHCGTSDNTTVIGSNVIILNHSHIAHDCLISDKANISANVTLAGHVFVMEGANLGLGVVVHQRTVIGAYSMIGMNSTVTTKSSITPGGIFVGSPAKFIKKNTLGLERGKVTDDQLVEFNDVYKAILNGSN